MIRHSQSYLFGAISGTAVIAAAVVFFVLFVSRRRSVTGRSAICTSAAATTRPRSSPGGVARRRRRDERRPRRTSSGPITGTRPTAPRGESHRRRPPQASITGNGNGKVSAETRIAGGRGVDSAPVQQPSSTTPATPAPTGGSGSSPAGSGTASPAPSSGNGASAGPSGQYTSTAAELGERRDQNRAPGDQHGQRNLQRGDSAGALAGDQRRRRSRRTHRTDTAAVGSTTDRVGDAIAGIGN